MLITHLFFYCLHCKMKIEIFYEMAHIEIECPECGHLNDMFDDKIVYIEEEF